MTNARRAPVFAVQRKAREPNARELFAGMSAALGAATMVMQYTAAALMVAAGEREAIDPARVFALLEVLADSFDRGVAAAGPTGKMTALMLRGVEETFRSPVTIPAGAGRA